ncbi:MAG: hypothetical protein HQM12_16495 [SAR324 cluster bacterium]|nr:hypothetical protein [SAR324 cluster bacterium]MBF0352462.1 hypothetical protein [SAR324 cluster bacterium]
MPRILRNYLISFLIIGIVLFVINLVDEHMKEQYEQELRNSAVTEQDSTSADQPATNP